MVILKEENHPHTRCTRCDIFFSRWPSTSAIKTLPCVPRGVRVNTAGKPRSSPGQEWKLLSRPTDDPSPMWRHSNTSDASSQPHMTTGRRWWKTYGRLGGSGLGCHRYWDGSGRMTGRPAHLKAVVQDILLFGLDMWVVTPRIVRV